MVIDTHNNDNNHSEFSEKMQRCQDYIHALEEERRKIQVFERELPLCLELVTQAIETCKQQLSGTTTECNLNGQSECNSEQTSSEVPVLEEFIPIKRPSSHSEDDDGEEKESRKPKSDANLSNKDVENSSDKNSKKSDWLRSVQLWNQTTDPPSKEETPRKVAVLEVNKNGTNGAFHPFKKDQNAAKTAAMPAPADKAVLPASTSSTAETGGSSGGGGGATKKEDKEGQSRKARRCWSPELHRRFVQALQQLGGAHVGTPKQIRDLMKVDGLTNDEVKSHLQKYRLHTRRPSPSIQNNNNTQTPQFVVVGGLWVPPEYAAMAVTTAEGSGVATNEIYAPIAKLPPPFQESFVSPKQRQHRSNHSVGDDQSHSPTGSSSSTHTTTGSQAC